MIDPLFALPLPPRVNRGNARAVIRVETNKFVQTESQKGIARRFAGANDFQTVQTCLLIFSKLAFLSKLPTARSLGDSAVSAVFIGFYPADDRNHVHTLYQDPRLDGVYFPGDPEA